MEFQDREYYCRVELQKRFRDVDVFGHINNNVYFEYMDLGKLTYMRTVMHSMPNSATDALVIANVNCDFLAPTAYDEPIAVDTRVESIGEHSLVMCQRVINTANGQVKCRARVVLVGFDPATRKTREISKEWHKIISDFEKREI